MSFSTNVPVRIAAKVYEKDPSWVRAGLITGYLPIGFATCDGVRVTELKKSRKRLSYYISAKLLYEATGFKWEGQNEYSITNGIK